MRKFLIRPKYYITTIVLFITLGCVSQSTITSVAVGMWTDPSTWDLGVPSTGDNVILDHNVSINVIDTVNNLRVNVASSCSDTLYVTGRLTLDDDFSVNPIVFVNNIVHKGRLGRVRNNASLNGTVVWQKWIKRCDGWAMYGSPFDVPMVDLGFLHTGFPGTAYPTFWANTYFYDETPPDIDLNIGWVLPAHVNDILPRGKGFMLFDSTSSPINAERVIELVGSTDLSENFDYNITYSGANNSTDNGWNLVSNPWPGTLNWDKNGWTKKKIQDAIWVWDNCTNNYASYINSVGVNGGEKFIPPGQSFWIKATRPNPTLKSTSTVIANPSREIKKSDGHTGLVRINLGDDEIAFIVNPEATNEHDNLYDASKFICSNSRVYTKIDSTEYAINSIYDKDTTSMYILGDGVLNFDLTELTDLPTIFYQDVFSGIVYDASIDPYYAFTSSSSGFYHRFNLILPRNTTTINEIEQTINKIVKYKFTILGQRVSEHYVGIVVEIYEDGSIRKLMIR
jgi:hypothetical protein